MSAGQRHRALLPGERIRADIEGAILSGAWPPGHRIAAEHALMEQYGCSRMTVNKVLTALARAGLISRRRRSGSFVAVPGQERAMMEIQNLAEQARRLGQSYRHEILGRKIGKASREQTESLGLRAGTALVHVICRHWIDERPYALEDRIISLSAVPGARAERFAAIPPGTWLIEAVPWSAAEHVIRARGAEAEVARLLAVKRGMACLELRRRTWHLERLVTEVTLTYPGDRHSFAGRFSPASG